MYNNPNCSFVSEFLGNPPVNRIKNTSDFLDYALKSQILQKKYKKFLSKNVFFEIRPECFKISQNKNAVKCKILRISRMGKEELAYLDFFGQEVCAILQNEEELSIGDEIFVEFKKRGLFVFDAITENRVEVE